MNSRNIVVLLITHSTIAGNIPRYHNKILSANGRKFSLPVTFNIANEH